MAIKSISQAKLLQDVEDYAQKNLNLLGQMEGRHYVIVSRSNDNKLHIYGTDSQLWSLVIWTFATLFHKEVYDNPDLAQRVVIQDLQDKLQGPIKSVTDQLHHHRTTYKVHSAVFEGAESCIEIFKTIDPPLFQAVIDVIRHYNNSHQDGIIPDQVTGLTHELLHEAEALSNKLQPALLEINLDKHEKVLEFELRALEDVHTELLAMNEVTRSSVQKKASITVSSCLDAYEWLVKFLSQSPQDIIKQKADLILKTKNSISKVLTQQGHAFDEVEIDFKTHKLTSGEGKPDSLYLHNCKRFEVYFVKKATKSNLTQIK